jgi:hypothetical protein
VRGGHHEQRVAVRRRACDCFGADRAAGSAAIVDDDLLAEDLTHLRCEHARDDVGVSTRCEGNDHAHRLGGILLRQRGCAEGECNSGERRAAARAGW